MSPGGGRRWDLLIRAIETPGFLLIFIVFKNNVLSSSLKTVHVKLVWRSWLTWGKICLPEWITNKQRQKHCEALQALWSSNTVDQVRKPHFSSWFFKWLTVASGLNSFPSQYFTIPFSKKIIKKRSGIDSGIDCTANATRFSSLLLCVATSLQAPLEEMSILM